MFLFDIISETQTFKVKRIKVFSWTIPKHPQENFKEIF